jgi:hypothetical protein
MTGLMRYAEALLKCHYILSSHFDFLWGNKVRTAASHKYSKNFTTLREMLADNSITN